MFFCSPVKLIKLIMSAPSTAAQIGEYQKKSSSAWYMSEEGKVAYREATTPAAKMHFLQSYLNAIKKEGTDREIVALAAYVIARGIDGTSLPFVTFPDILDPSRNPVVNVISKKTFSMGKRPECGMEILNALLGGSASKVADWYNPEMRAYERLKTCSDGNSPSDMYKLQCYVIGAFCCFENKSSAPYVYDIVLSARNISDKTNNDAEMNKEATNNE